MISQTDYDVIVVGGGATGAGIARDLARRGVSVLLLEKGDYGGATTGGSSWLLHGGTRYLAFDWETTRRSCEDAGHIVNIARHLVHRVVFLLPIVHGDPRGLERLETALEVYDRLQPLKHSHAHLRLDAEEALDIEPGLRPDLEGAVTMEEWGVDPHRLTWLNVQDALAHGATAVSHAEVEDVIREDGRVVGVSYRVDGARRDAHARVVVNAGGPWVPELADLAGCELRLRPTKGVHIVYDRRLSNFALSAEAVDGRSLLMVPCGNFTLLGTTDDDYYGDLDSLEVLEEEVDYILEGFARVMPSIRDYPATRATVGVRPTLFRWRPNEDVLSRRFEVFDHATRDGIDGFVSIAGGKLSMYRAMAEETSDVICRKLGVFAASDTATAALPGHDGELEPPDELAREFRLSAFAVVRLQTRHGTAARSVLEESRSARVICRCDPVTESELVHAARQEQVATLADAFRRVGLASGPCAGTRCVDFAAAVIGRELGWSRSQVSEASETFRAESWLGRLPVLDEFGWAQEELAHGLAGARPS